MTKVVTLDERIRAKAKEEAETKFWRDWKALTDVGHSGTWVKDFKYEDMQEFRGLAESFLHRIVVPKAQQDAINTFYATYQNLIREYPDLVVEDSHD